MKDSNVIILGGGLASLTLALQLKNENSDITITILEMRKNEASLSAHKVGESTVELGTYYLREVLGLADYLDEYHLPKYGLRFYFNNNNAPIENRVEYGPDRKIIVPSHQLDRGLLENDLMDMLRDLDVNIISGARTKNVELKADNHKVTYTIDGKDKVLTSNWVVDASGRAGILKRQEKLAVESPHDINAVWFRVKGKIDVEDWSTDQEWKDKLEPDFRRLGTIHFMGKGYWVWFIPLSSGNTSIGIVADPRFHNFSELDTLDKSYEWLEKNEPLCYKHLIKKKEDVLDFKRLKHYSHDSKMVFSTDKWGCIGEAGMFLDPFYSPGTDFIAMSNGWMSDLILSDFKGENVFTKSIIYNEISKIFFKSWLPIYHEKYELFGNTQVMNVKITWDFAVYWSIPCLLFTNDGLTNSKIIKSISSSKNGLAKRFENLNYQVQKFYLDWGRRENISCLNKSFVPNSLSYINDLHKKLVAQYNSEEELLEQLEENITLLEKIGAELFRYISHRLNGTPIDLKASVYTMDLNLSKEEIIALGEQPGTYPRDEKLVEITSKLWFYDEAL